MKKIPSKFFPAIFATCAALASALESSGAVSFTVIPSVISNGYAGAITFQITGLTNTEKVTLTRYLDVNSNGVVDAGEAVIDAGKPQDGGVSTIGGVTNLNVPFDSNSTTGAITTSFALLAPVDQIVGQSIYRVSSPSSRFTPTNVNFIVTNAALAQSVSGVVFSNNAPMANAIVVALRQPNNDFAGATVADSTGHYLLKLSPGTYSVLPTLFNFYTDQSKLPIAVLTNGVSATNNLYLTNGTVTIAGNVYDAANSNGIAGVFLQLQSGNFFAVAFTDTNGNYSAAVTSGNWKVKPASEHLARRAYVSQQGGVQADTSGGNVTNANIAFYKANALFYGRLTDVSNAPFANISFSADDDSGQFKANGFSDANGNYTVAVLVTNGNSWQCSPENGNTVLASYIIGSGLGTTNILDGQALLQNLTALRATATISGKVQDNHGNPVSGVSLNGNATIAGTSYNTTQVTTDSGGNYSMNVASGNWSVFVNCCGSEGLDNFGLFDPFSHFVNIPPTNDVLNITVYLVGTPFLSQPRRTSPSQFQFQLDGTSGQNYTVQGSFNLQGTNDAQGNYHVTNWFNVLTTNAPNNSFIVVDPNATNLSRRAYRVLVGP